MSRSEKRRKRENRERMQAQSVTQIVHARRTRSAVEEAAWLIDNGHWRDARAKLEECDRLSPGQRDVLYLLAEVHQHDKDHVSCVRTCEQMLAQNPGERTIHLLLANSYLWTMRPLAATRLLKSFLERWPRDMNAGQARKMLESIEPAVAELLDKAPFPESEKLELSALHEESLCGLAVGNLEKTIRAGERLLARSPEFVSAMNNLAVAYHECGRTADALAMSQRALEYEPNNIHALANLTRHTLQEGQLAAAQTWGERLRESPAVKMACCVKKAEAFSFLGDDLAVTRAFEDSRKFNEHEISPPELAMLHHLAAVAYARLGDSATAVRLWKKSLKMHPVFELARDNLDDEELPVGERHGPWPFSANYWIRKETLRKLIAKFELGRSSADDKSDEKVVASILALHPEFPALISLLLDRGDVLARSLACRLAKSINTPECLDALQRFCLSNRGPDQMRIDLANELARNSLLPPGMVRLCVKGEWQDIELLGFEISDEPRDAGYAHSETGTRLRDAIKALGQGRGEEAERLLRQCLAAEGDRPELLNNLDTAFVLQDRLEESRALRIQVHARWPDYFFGRAAMAAIAAEDGDFDRANSLLADLRRQRRFHTTEFAALCEVTIQVFMVQQNINAAGKWLQIWKDAQPGHPLIAEIERVLNRSSVLCRVKDWWPSGSGKRA